MANHKSAKKRAIQNVKKRDRNMAVRTQMKNAVKAVRSAGADKAENMTDTLIKATSVIDGGRKKRRHP